ncbi:hypothetical protein [Nocardia asteroides]|uniref:hypothetical protein n=1 Tax=Nocardia asteroides TaxID=1824 RepID=UPI001E4E648A|nr:hypothetical protein [Nocardia asteroides]UGT58369.1 hypothetical protein LTT85_16655 [Nocardia asteroides]
MSRDAPFPFNADAVVADLESALELDLSGSNDHDSRVGYFEKAMDGLVQLECAVLRREFELDDSVSGWRRGIASLVDSNSRTMAYFVMHCHYRATSVVVDGWRDVSARRSAMQFLLDNYPGVGESWDEGDAELIDEIDDVLRDHADEVAPLPKDDIPSGIPESH